MTVKEMNQKISLAVDTVNMYLPADISATAEELLNALAYNVVAEEVANQIIFLRNERGTNK